MKMKWFRKLLNQKNEDHIYVPNMKGQKPNLYIDSKSSISFVIYPANGGYVVEHSLLRRHADSAGTTLTLVNREEDLGTAIAHIITLESLKA
jgi:hypothetical protein